MAYELSDFTTAIAAAVSAQPQAALYYQAGDPRLLASLNAMAVMLTMLSQQVDIESTEVWEKTRDTSVLADSTMKGILPYARPPTMTVTVLNGSPTDVLPIAIGRVLLDQNGAVYTATSAVSLAPGATGTVSVKQMTTRTFDYTVSGSVPFFTVVIPPNADTDQVISGLYVAIAGVDYPFTPEFANLAANQPGFTIETNELRQLLVKFGWDQAFGIQPANGTVINFTIEETTGATTLAVNAAFTLQSTAIAADRLATFKLASVVFPGADAIDIATLRELATYPSGYDDSAVYLGNFDFLIRRNLTPLRFLSVWNEQIEESVRGASINNINRLFISCLMDNVDPDFVESQITQIVAAADDSYWPMFVQAVEVEVPLTITAQVSVVHDVGDVEAQIIAQVLALYGRDAIATSQGMLALSNRKISAALNANITALQDDGADFQVMLAVQTNLLPEQFRYVSAASLTVNVQQATYNDGQWSH